MVITESVSEEARSSEISRSDCRCCVYVTYSIPRLYVCTGRYNKKCVVISLIIRVNIWMGRYKVVYF